MVYANVVRPFARDNISYWERQLMKRPTFLCSLQDICFCWPGKFKAFLLFWAIHVASKGGRGRCQWLHTFSVYICFYSLSLFFLGCICFYPRLLVFNIYWPVIESFVLWFCGKLLMDFHSSRICHPQFNSWAIERERKRSSKD